MTEVETEQTKTELLMAQLSWATRPSGNGENVAVQMCPFCSNTNWKFFVHVGGEKDGLFSCKVCSEQGNFYTLREKLGIRTVYE